MGFAVLASSNSEFPLAPPHSTHPLPHFSQLMEAIPMMETGTNNLSIFQKEDFQFLKIPRSFLYRRMGVRPTGKSFRFVSLVRACARSGWLVEFDPKRGTDLVPFPFCHGGLSLFPSPTPQTSYPIVVGLIHKRQILNISTSFRNDRIGALFWEWGGEG